MLHVLGTPTQPKPNTHLKWYIAARFVTRRYHNTSSVTQMPYYLHWLTLEQRRAISILTMLYKITNNLVAIPASSYLTRWSHPTTRSHNLCYMPYSCNANTLKYSFFPRTITLWNLLPQHIASSQTLLRVFQDTLPTWIITRNSL